MCISLLPFSSFIVRLPISPDVIPSFLVHAQAIEEGGPNWSNEDGSTFKQESRRSSFEGKFEGAPSETVVDWKSQVQWNADDGPEEGSVRNRPSGKIQMSIKPAAQTSAANLSDVKLSLGTPAGKPRATAHSSGPDLIRTDSVFPSEE